MQNGERIEKDFHESRKSMNDTLLDKAAAPHKLIKILEDFNSLGAKVKPDRWNFDKL